MSDRLRVSIVLVAFGILYAVAALWGCGPVPPPQPPGPGLDVYGTLTVHVCDGPCSADVKIPRAAVILRDGASEITLVADGAGNAHARLLPGVWRVEVAADGYEAWSGTISLRAGGSGTLRAELARLQIPSRGSLRIAGGMFVDDHGPTLPIFCHFGEAFSAFVRRPTAVRHQLQVIADAGYYGVRVWTTLGGTYWAGREVGPDVTPDYWLHVTSFLEALREVGLVAEVSVGDIGMIRDRRVYAERMADACHAVGISTCAVWESGNEAWQTGEADAERLAEFARWFWARPPPPLLILTSPPGETKAELDAYSIPPASMFAVHGFRGFDWVAKVRHIWGIAYEQRPALRLGWQNEPAGPGRAVSVTENQHELTAETLPVMAAMSLIARQGWTYMSGAGVRWDYPLEQEPGFFEVARVAALLPPDVMSYDLLVHGGETWAAHRIFKAEGETRADCAIAHDGRFACLLYGLDRDVRACEPVRPVQITLDYAWSAHARLVTGRRQSESRASSSRRRIRPVRSRRARCSTGCAT